jgi:hypothetical protein
VSSVVTSESFEPIGCAMTNARIQPTSTAHLLRRPVTIEANLLNCAPD